MRLDPNRVEVPPIEPVRKQYVQERKYKLLTPLFGGGVEPKVADPITVIRIPEIRGQLRFWWRACRGGQFGGDLAKMKAAEDAIWGAAGRASAVSISLTEVPASNPPDKKDIPQYAAFPLEDGLNLLRDKVQFVIRLAYRTDLKPEIDAALWAWETFGGIGGRTRRGFGAIQCTEIDRQEETPSNARMMEELIRRQLRHHIAGGNWHPDVPHLSKDMDFRLIDSPNATQAWKKLIEKLRTWLSMILE